MNHTTLRKIYALSLMAAGATMLVLSLLYLAGLCAEAATGDTDAPASLLTGNSQLATLPLAVPVIESAPVNPWLALVPVLVPLLVALLKEVVPSVPARWLPLIAAGAGPLLAALDQATGIFGHNPMAVIFLGAAGTGVRELVDQWKHKVTGAAAVSALLAMGSLLLFTGCRLGKPDGRITSVTQSVIGISIGQSSADAVPHIQLGYTRSQFHIVPTGTNNFAPAVLSSMSLDNTFSHQVIDEEFATGGATRDFNESSPGAVGAKARAAKTAPAK